ncbi:MAG TPA: hypothetical protein VMT59_13430 [Gaiellaceae bacterium]|nr:hypothetical protein [Gaiellaceae bacterium]
MYGTFRYYQGNSELADALTENADEVKKVLSAIEGFKAYYLILTGDGSTLSFTVFETEAGADESNRVAAEWLRENAPEVSVNPPNISAGPVLISG